MRVTVRRHVHQRHVAKMAGLAEDAAVSAGRAITAWPCVDLRYFSRGEILLLLDHQHATTVASLLVAPHGRADQADRIENVLRSIRTGLALWTLRRVAAHRQRRVEQQVEPV